MVQRGKIKEASRIINQDNKGGILSPDTIIDGDRRTVFDILKEKHPNGTMPHPELLRLYPAT